MYALRNIRMCNKDCVCLFVCPTGATDTETGQINRDRCIEGCRLCVDACPSHAIYLVMETYAQPAPKEEQVVDALLALCSQKSGIEELARATAETASKAGDKASAAVARALMRSTRILAEDCAREAGFMTPQTSATEALLAELAVTGNEASRAIAGRLRSLLENAG